MSNHRIIIVGPAYPYRGGNALFVSHLYEALSRYFEVSIINYTLLYPSILFPGKTQFDKSKRVIKKTPSERLINSINPISWLKTAKKILKTEADLVVFDWWNPFFGPAHFVISYLLRKKYKNRILFITENIISHESRWIDKFLTHFGLKYASCFLTLSSKVAEQIDQIARGKKVYRSELPIYNFYSSHQTFDPERQKEILNIDPEDKVLLFFGYVRKYKGLDILLRAIPDVLKNKSKVKLIIVGEFYDNPQIYTDLIKELEIEPSVTIIDQFVPNEDVGRYYSVADLVVLPYRSGTQSGILNIAYT